MILGYIGAPIVWLMGVCKEDMFLVGQLLGEKTVLNDFKYKFLVFSRKSIKSTIFHVISSEDHLKSHNFYQVNNRSQFTKITLIKN